jgi:hypothetical protein
MWCNHWKVAVSHLALVFLWGCGTARTKNAEPASVSLEVFVVSPAVDSETVRYVRRITKLSSRTTDPDAAARELTRGIGEPAILHSTSWRWEKDGTIVLSYLAYCENARFHGFQPVQLRWDRLARPPATNPQHPRPPEIREEVVVSHGLRHLSFLIRYARDGRLAAALSPRSLTFFKAMCGQLAGRLDAARDFEECAAVGAR